MKEEKIKKIMNAIEELQQEKAAIVILEDADGGTTYLRHNISKEAMLELLRLSYGVGIS